MTNIVDMPAGSDIFESEAEVLVCPVNLIGAMDAGLSLQFLTRYSTACSVWVAFVDQIQRAADCGAFFPFLLVPVAKTEHPALRSIYFLPVHMHPMEKADPLWIEGGIISLLSNLNQDNVKRVAIPALGCGIGGLEWSFVKGVIIRSTEGNVQYEGMIELYPPLNWSARLAGGRFWVGSSHHGRR